MKCSIGICAYNEEKNIGKLLEALMRQEADIAELDEIIIVASGCTDRTVEIAEDFARRDARVRVIAQEKREGKAAAVGVFLREAKHDILVLESADTIPQICTVEYLVRPFQDPAIGMTGARPVPVDSPHTLMGYTTHLLWSLHHAIALQNPKMGEMIALRRVVREMPRTSVDEAYLESAVQSAGFVLQYVPEAIVHNKGPETLSDFFRQRRHIHWGHLHLKHQTGHAVSTASIFATLGTIWKQFCDPADYFLRRYIYYLPVAVALEGWGRALGYWDYYIVKREHIIWDVRESTKNLDSRDFI